MDTALGRTQWVNLPLDVVETITAEVMSGRETNVEARAIWHHPSQTWTFRSNKRAHQIPFLINYLHGKYKCRVPAHILPAPEVSDHFDEELPYIK